jgi:streptogramin lyase
MDACLGGYLCLCEGKLQATCDRWSTRPWAYFVSLLQSPGDRRGIPCDPARPPDGGVPPAACSITEFAIPTPDSGPRGIVARGDDVWFTESATGKVARLSPSGTITEFPLPDPMSHPLAITVGADENLWFTESSKIGRITPSGTIDEFPLPSAGSSPYGIASGPDGNLWFTDSGTAKIGRISPSGTVTEFVLPGKASAPLGITASRTYYSDVLFAEFAAGKIGRINALGNVAEAALPGASGAPFALTDDLWFTEPAANQIGSLSAFNNGIVTEFAVPTANGWPMGITQRLSADYAWFTEFRGDKIGRVSRGGAITEFPLAAGSGPYGIAVGTDFTTLWFTENGSNKIGRLAACPDGAMP